MTNVGRHVTAVLFAVGGSALLSWALVAMNAKAHGAREVKKSLEAAIQVREQKKPPPKKAPPKPKPRPRPSRSRPAPRPTFSSNLSGMGAGIPVFSASDLAGLTGDPLAGEDAVKDMVMTADTVDSQPERIPDLCPLPTPPSRAIKRGITGIVRAGFLVNKDGRPEGIRVIESKPEGVFDDAVIEALSHWQMKPATYGGQPVAVSTEVSFPFR